MRLPYSKFMITTDQFRQQIQSKEESSLGFISPPTLYYLRVFKVFSRQKLFLSWNWAAFFASFLNIGHLWLAYRKMYVLAGLYWLLSNGIVLSLVVLSMHILPRFVTIEGKILPLKIGYGLGTLLLCNLMGVFANAIYFASIRHKIKQSAIQKGGTSSTAALIAFIIGMAILSLIKRFSGIHL